MTHVLQPQATFPVPLLPAMPARTPLPTCFALRRGAGGAAPIHTLGPGDNL